MLTQHEQRKVRQLGKMSAPDAQRLQVPQRVLGCLRVLAAAGNVPKTVRGLENTLKPLTSVIRVVSPSRLLKEVGVSSSSLPEITCTRRQRVRVPVDEEKEVDEEKGECEIFMMLPNGQRVVVGRGRGRGWEVGVGWGQRVGVGRGRGQKVGMLQTTVISQLKCTLSPGGFKIRTEGESGSDTTDYEALLHCLQSRLQQVTRGRGASLARSNESQICAAVEKVEAWLVKKVGVAKRGDAQEAAMETDDEQKNSTESLKTLRNEFVDFCISSPEQLEAAQIVQLLSDRGVISVSETGTVEYLAGSQEDSPASCSVEDTLKEFIEEERTEFRKQQAAVGGPAQQITGKKRQGQKHSQSKKHCQ